MKHNTGITGIFFLTYIYVSMIQTKAISKPIRLPENKCQENSAKIYSIANIVNTYSEKCNSIIPFCKVDEKLETGEKEN